MCFCNIDFVDYYEVRQLNNGFSRHVPVRWISEFVVMKTLHKERHKNVGVNYNYSIVCGGELPQYHQRQWPVNMAITVFSCSYLSCLYIIYRRMIASLAHVQSVWCYAEF